MSHLKPTPRQIELVLGSVTEYIQGSAPHPGTHHPHRADGFMDGINGRGELKGNCNLASEMSERGRKRVQARNKSWTMGWRVGDFFRRSGLRCAEDF